MQRSTAKIHNSSTKVWNSTQRSTAKTHSSSTKVSNSTQRSTAKTHSSSTKVSNGTQRSTEKDTQLRHTKYFPALRAPTHKTLQYLQCMQQRKSFDNVFFKYAPLLQISKYPWNFARQSIFPYAPLLQISKYLRKTTRQRMSSICSQEVSASALSKRAPGANETVPSYRHLLPASWRTKVQRRSFGFATILRTTEVTMKCLYNCPQLHGLEAPNFQTTCKTQSYTSSMARDFFSRHPVNPHADCMVTASHAA